MTYLSIIEKLQILFNTLLDFKFIMVFIILFIIFTLLYILKKVSTKKYSLCMLMSFIVLFLISIISNYEILSNTFDNFATIFFGSIYFPSIYVYIGILVISLISFVVSILNVMLKKIYKIINSIMFVLNNILFVIILNIIAKNKIDIFSVVSLYSDTTLVAILELSMGLVILWVLALIAVYATNCLCERLSHKKVYNIEIEKNEVIFNPILEINNDIANNEDNINNEFVMEDIIEENTITNNDSIIIQSNDVANREVIVVQSQTCDNKVETMLTFNDILNENIPVTYYDKENTSEEYKLVDPQVIYEKKYNEIKCQNVTFNNIDIQLDNDINEELELSLEEKTLKEKEKRSEERLITNTISLNDLIKEEENNCISEIENEVQDNETANVVNSTLEVNGNTGYTIDDYKKIIKMLNELKTHSNCSNINIDDAVALSLISNYSVDDCMKFRNILENNLN